MKFSRAIVQCDLKMHSSDLSELLTKPLNSLKPYPVNMVSSSSKVNQGSSILVHGLEGEESNIQFTRAIAETLDPSGA